MKKNILLASFIKRDKLDEALDILKNTNKVLNNKVFVLRDSANKNKLILTYNILIEDDKIDFDKLIKGTISLHRKKETNTLYTLNALNEVVKSENDNKLDESYVIQWEKHRNCILIAPKNKGLIKIKTVLESVKNI